MLFRKNSAAARQAGFGLVEILVGVAIGAIASLVIVQVVTSFEGQKRGTGGSADAQTNGSVALYTIQRDGLAAGFGLPVYSARNSPLNCPLLVDDDNNPATPGVDISPVTITDGGVGAGASDIITIRSGTDTRGTGGIPITITGVLGNVLTVTNNMACSDGDRVIVSRGGACLMNTIAPTGISGNPGTTQITLLSAAGVTSGSSIACLPGWRVNTYQVNNGNLELNGARNVAGIVNIQAQYGISTTGRNNTVTQWVDAGGAVANAVDFRNSIKALRIAIVSRNGLLEANNVTDACSSLVTPNPTGLCAWAGTAASPAPPIDLSNDPNWRRYRYRVFETVIPMRNVLWSRGSLQ
jgi:type IV pilus assembly protein PilW